MSEILDARRLAQTKLEARRVRAAVIHQRIAVFAFVLMVGVWVAIFSQLALGHDPALAPKHTLVAATSPRAGAPLPVAPHRRRQQTTHKVRLPSRPPVRRLRMSKPAVRRPVASPVRPRAQVVVRQAAPVSAPTPASAPAPVSTRQS